MSNFAQYAIQPFKAGEAITGSLTTGWDVDEESILITYPMVREMLKRRDNPRSFTIRPTSKRYEFALAYLAKHGQNNVEHVQKFADQEATRAYRKSVTEFTEERASRSTSIRKFLDGLK